MRIRHSLIACVILLLISSCTSTPSDEPDTPPTTHPEPTRAATRTPSPLPPTETPLPTLPGGFSLGNEALEKASVLCDQAFSDGLSTPWTWAPSLPAVLLLDVEYDETGWMAVDTLGNPDSEDELRVVVCAFQTRIDQGMYLPIGGRGYQLRWDMWILGLEEGEPLGSRTFMGGMPPSTVSTSGSHYGSSPRFETDPWLEAVFSDPWAPMNSTPVSMQLAFDNTVLLVDGGYSLLSLDPETGEQLNEIQYTEDRSYTPWLSLSPDGSLFAAAVCLQEEDRSCIENSVQIRNTTDGSLSRTLTWNNEYPLIYNLAFSPDNQFLYVGYSGNIDRTTRYYIHRWNLSTGAGTDIIADEIGRDSELRVSPDGAQLIVAEAYSFGVWDIVTAEHLAGFEASANRIDHPAGFSPDSSMFAVAHCLTGGYGPCEQGEIHVYDTGSYELAWTLGSSITDFNSLAFSPDGTLLAGASCNGVQYYAREDGSPAQVCTSGVIILWDLTTGEEIARREGHTGEIRSLVFSADGTSLYSGSTDGTIRKWDTGSE
ncbi:MAG: hypothetical protein JXA25_11415 [Anaerolineales bacterium]|nr:hypothetical protein [Anaerolineales bacterium]